MTWSELPGVGVGIAWIGLCVLAFWGIASIGQKEIVAWVGRKRSQHWPQSIGKVVSKDVEKFPRSWVPKIEYEYMVSGFIYRSERISFEAPGHNASTLEAVNSFLDDYPIDGEVVVYYDPQNPVNSTLSRTGPGCVWPIFVLVFMLLPIVTIVLVAGIGSLTEVIRKLFTK